MHQKLGRNSIFTTFSISKYAPPEVLKNNNKNKSLDAYESFRDSQAKTRAAICACGRSAALSELFKQRVQLVYRNPAPHQSRDTAHLASVNGPRQDLCLRNHYPDNESLPNAGVNHGKPKPPNHSGLLRCIPVIFVVGVGVAATGRRAS